MNIPDGLLPDVWLWAAHVLFVAILGTAVFAAPWSRLKDNETLHVFLGTCVGLMLLWSIRAGISPGLSFHHLGATLLTLMFGWRLAIVGLSLVLFATTLNGMAGWESFSVNALVMVVLPVMLSQAVYRVVDRKLPNHFFVYIFLCAFLAAALSMAASASAAVWVLSASGVYSMERMAYEYLPFFPLMVFPEALFNGMVMTALVGLRPGWVCTFDDERYLKFK
jgi:uncharacterized membrane protein